MKAHASASMKRVKASKLQHFGRLCQISNLLGYCGPSILRSFFVSPPSFSGSLFLISCHGIDPPIYPDLIIYPPMSMSTTNIHRPHNHEVSRDLITTSLTPAYPCVLPYPPVYPHLNPYNQGHTEQRINQLLPTQLPDNGLPFYF